MFTIDLTRVNSRFPVIASLKPEGSLLCSRVSGLAYHIQIGQNAFQTCFAMRNCQNRESFVRCCTWVSFAIINVIFLKSPPYDSKNAFEKLSERVSAGHSCGVSNQPLRLGQPLLLAGRLLNDLIPFVLNVLIVLIAVRTRFVFV